MAAPLAETGRNWRRSKVAGALLGVGMMAAVDEIIFHQVLAWHHFYDGSTPALGLLTDGLLHTAELLFLVAGFFMIAQLRGQQVFSGLAARAGFFMGAGGFQLFDGLINHKVLRLHQIRYGVDNLLAYDIAWNLTAALMLLTGIVLSHFASQSRQQRLMQP
jgi:uncharacterized membrane protein